ncbi:protein indc11 [Hypoxylon cercidicola]|nr:protein indc11 [Hypoxylon cercidicola]
MTSIRKVVITKFGDADVLKVLDDVCPPPPSGHVQIATEYASFGGSDISMRNGKYPLQRKAPLTPGYALVGTVRATGEGCKELQVGDVVVALTIYDADSQLVNQPEKYCIKVPDGADHQQAAALICDWLTAYGMVKRTAKVSKGQRVFIHGMSGAVGCAVVILCRLQGAEVYGTASERNHDTIRQYGATPFVYTDKKWMERMKELGGAHAVFDPLGFESFDESYSILGEGGFLVGYGNNKAMFDEKPRSPVLPIMKMLSRNLNFTSCKRTTMFVVSRNSSTYRSEVAELLDMSKNGTITAPIKNVWNMEDIQTAHRQWGGGDGIGSLLIKVADN